MANLIDKTFFVGELNIPNTSTPAIGEVLDFFIAKYEPMFLKAAFGLPLYDAFIAGLAEVPVPQIWTDLKAGIQYTDTSGRAYTYLPLVDTTNKLSPIANYVYYWFMRNNHTQTTTMGEAGTSKENAVNANPTNKMVRAWNEMVDWVGGLRYFMNTKAAVYPQYNAGYGYLNWGRFRRINEFNI